MSYCTWPCAARYALTLQQRGTPSDPAVDGSSAPTPHQTPLLSSQTLFDTGICVHVVEITHGPLTPSSTWMFWPTCVKFVLRMLGCFGLTRYGSIDCESI